MLFTFREHFEITKKKKQKKNKKRENQTKPLRTTLGFANRILVFCFSSVGPISWNGLQVMRHVCLDSTDSEVQEAVPYGVCLTNHWFQASAEDRCLCKNYEERPPRPQVLRAMAACSPAGQLRHWGGPLGRGCLGFSLGRVTPNGKILIIVMICLEAPILAYYIDLGRGVATECRRKEPFFGFLTSTKTTCFCVRIADSECKLRL